MSGSSTPGTSRRGYGNIYTPHAGSMVIQVQREGGLQSRTIVLSPRQVQLLRFFLSRSGRVLGVIVAVAAIGLAVEASRVPVLTGGWRRSITRRRASTRWSAHSPSSRSGTTKCNGCLARRRRDPVMR